MTNRLTTTNAPAMAKDFSDKRILRPLYDYVNSRGLDGYLVGGSVRDALLNREGKDTDVLIPGIDETGFAGCWVLGSEMSSEAPKRFVEDLSLLAEGEAYEVIDRFICKERAYRYRRHAAFDRQLPA